HHMTPPHTHTPDTCTPLCARTRTRTHTHTHAHAHSLTHTHQTQVLHCAHTSTQKDLQSIILHTHIHTQAHRKISRALTHTHITPPQHTTTTHTHTHTHPPPARRHTHTHTHTPTHTNRFCPCSCRYHRVPPYGSWPERFLLPGGVCSVASRPTHTSSNAAASQSPPSPPVA